MSEQPRKATIGSVICIDFADHTDKPVFKQVRDKERLNRIIEDAIRDVSPEHRVLVDAVDGKAIALFCEPEAALFIAMTIRDAIVRHNNAGEDTLFIRTGIGIGPVRIAETGGLASLQGDGYDVAASIKNLAAPNQILVSRTYHDITAGLTDEIAGMYTPFAGVQDAYAIQPSEDEPFVPESATQFAEAEPLISRLLDNDDAPRYGLWGSVALVAIAVLVGGFLLFSNLLHPDLGVVVADSKPKAPAADLQTVSAPATAPEVVSPQPHVAAPNLEAPADPGTEIVALEPSQPTALPDESLPQMTRSRAAQAAAVRSPSTQPVAITEETEINRFEFEDDHASDDPEALPETPVVTPPETRKVATAPRARSGPAVEERSLPTRGTRPKTIWDGFRESFKQGRKEHVCTQAEIALNQCK